VPATFEKIDASAPLPLAVTSRRAKLPLIA
jgi:hypothetical protein